MPMRDDVNSSIGCTVHDCTYHAQSKDYCTLSKIQVTQHHTPANTKECTDCGSFETKNS
jgi:hypothetical protein